MIIGIPSEIKTGEKRVAMSPANVQSLTDKSVKVLVQKNAGSAAGYPDAEYNAAGATTIADRAEIFATADIILKAVSYTHPTLSTSYPVYVPLLSALFNYKITHI